MLAHELLNWINGHGVLVGLLTFLAGTLVGHWLAIHRDDRGRRAAVFAEVRRRIASARGPVFISAADEDAALAVCVWWRRRCLRKAISRCNQAARDYYDGTDAWGQPTTTPAREADMAAAIKQLVKLLRRP